MAEIVGVLGGMGTESTAYFFNLVVKWTQANNDKEHVPMIIYNNPGIPDRTAAITGHGKSPLPSLIGSARLLEKAGATLIVIPCNTAHYFFNQIVKEINIPVINMIEETRLYIKKNHPFIKKAGLLATTGMIESGLFQKILMKLNIEAITPGHSMQKQVMAAIYGEEGIKASYKTIPVKILRHIGQALLKDGAEAIITGCTEVSMVLNESDAEMALINSLDILARSTVIRAGYRLRRI